MADLKLLFGKNVATHRRRRGWTQDQLAGEAHVSVDMIKRLETGRVGASFEVVEKLSKALQVAVADLFASADENDRLALRRLIAELADMTDENIAWLQRLLVVVRERL